MNEQLMKIASKPGVVPTVVGVAALGVGFGLGYFVNRRKTIAVVKGYQQYILDQQVHINAAEGTIEDLMGYKGTPECDGQMTTDEVEYNDIPLEEGDDSFPAVSALADKLGMTAYSIDMRDEDDELADELEEEDMLQEEELDDALAEGVSLFADRDSEWIWSKETEERTDKNVYIIHEDEWAQHESGFRQETITFYEGDNKMADPHDTPIQNWKQLVGDLNWGHGSSNRNSVFVRNEAIRMEWEILLHSGSFEHEILGLQFEDAPSPGKGRRVRFEEDD